MVGPDHPFLVLLGSMHNAVGVAGVLLFWFITRVADKLQYLGRRRHCGCI
jgi:hypothetical protein